MFHLRTGSKHLIREINQAIVLNTIRTHGALSRTEIAQLSHLGLPTISAITAELIEAGLLYERATGASTGGRPRVALALNAQAGYAVGVKLTEEVAILVLSTSRGRPSPSRATGSCRATTFPTTPTSSCLSHRMMCRTSRPPTTPPVVSGTNSRCPPIGRGDRSFLSSKG